jgi:hypothetical protein
VNKAKEIVVGIARLAEVTNFGRRGVGSTPRRAPVIAKAASVGGLIHDSLDNGPRGAWSSPSVSSM